MLKKQTLLILLLVSSCGVLESEPDLVCLVSDKSSTN